MPPDNTRPLVVMVILNVNQKENTLKFLESIYRIDYPLFEVVVVDNGSSDGSAEAVTAAFAAAHVIKNGTNQGCAAGRNIGIEYAYRNFAFEYLLFLDNDTVVDKHFLTELVKGIRSDAGAGIANPKVYFLSRPGVIQYAGSSKMNFYTGICSCSASGQTDRGQFDQSVYSKLAIGTCLLAKKAVLQKIKGFDPAFDPYGMEDRDFSLRASKAGFKIKYVPSAVIHHKDSKTPSGGKYNAAYTSLKGRNLKTLMKRNSTLIQWICFYAIAPFLAARTVIREARKNNTKAALTLLKSFFGR
jgi:GT2 family glycosyltransferase